MPKPDCNTARSVIGAALYRATEAECPACATKWNLTAIPKVDWNIGIAVWSAIIARFNEELSECGSPYNTIDPTGNVMETFEQQLAVTIDEFARIVCED